MRDLLLVLPELVLAGMALVLIVISRHIRRGQTAAFLVIVAAAAAVYADWAISPGGSRIGFGATIASDGYAQFFNVLFAATLALTVLLSVRYLEAEHVPAGEYFGLLLLASAGMMLAASATELLVLYLGLELMTLCSYVLVGITRDRQISNEAAIKYFLLGSFASALFLYGITLIFGVTGATDFAGIASAVTERDLGQYPLLRIGVALVVGGLAFKIAAVPFHSWAPDAYQGATRRSRRSWLQGQRWPGGHRTGLPRGVRTRAQRLVGDPDRACGPVDGRGEPACVVADRHETHAGLFVHLTRRVRAAWSRSRNRRRRFCDHALRVHLCLHDALGLRHCRGARRPW